MKIFDVDNVRYDFFISFPYTMDANSCRISTHVSHLSTGHSYQDFSDKQINGRKFKSKEENKQTHTHTCLAKHIQGAWLQFGLLTSTQLLKSAK